MNKTFFKIGLGLLALAGLAWPSRGAVTGMKTLHGHVPSIVSHLAKTGDLAPTNNLHLAIGLQLRNEAALDDLIRQVTDPASPNYGHYLTREEFTEQFAPSESDYQAVVDFARQHGLTVTATPANRMLVEVNGQAADVERAFNVSLHTYRHPAENRTFFAPDTDPSVPAGLAILDVGGLNNYDRPHSQLHLRPNATNTPAASIPQLGSGPNGSYMGNDFRAAYVPGAPQTGTGQNIALVQFDGYLSNDITLYETLNSLPAVSLTNILLNGFNGIPTGNGGEVEVSLDIEMVISMAPGLNRVGVYEGDPFNFLPNVVLNQIAVDNSARQISCSWTWTGGPNATSDQIFKEMILQGQSFFHSSADFDAFLPGEVDDPTFILFPSSDPYITQVGGTTLSTTGPGGSYVSETVWNWDVEFAPNDDGIGSSGGISSFYPIPSWQTNIDMTLNGGSSTFRNIPDVALTGDNVLVIADGGVFYPGTGGTSCASPLWAGFTALINQQAASVGHAPMGFINPALYALASGPNYNLVFHDTTTGSNTWSQSPNLFVAVTNYDLCTGLGTPNGTNLINILTSTNFFIPVAPIFPAPKQPWGNTLSVMNGSDPNGLWLLFIQDDTLNNYAGTNYNGWAVNLTTANPVGFAADNELYINAANVSVAPGGQWTTTLAVTNYGPSVSTNVFVTDTLPSPGVALVSSSSTIPGSTTTTLGSTLIWNVGNLSVGTGGTLSLNFQANSAGIYTNGATVAATTPDPNPDDDSVGVNIAVGVSTPPVLAPYLVPGGGGALQLSVNNDAGSTVVIQASTNLITWLPVYTNVSPFIFTTFDTTNYSQRFYRAVVGQ